MYPAATTAPIVTTVADSARVWNALLGGKDNYPVDREAAHQFNAICPMTDVAQKCRHFHARVIRHAADTGIGQYLDLGAGLPTVDNTHEVAERIVPDARTVYVDKDRLVMVHARSLLTTREPARVGYVEADLGEVDTVLAQAAQTLDLAQPVAVLLTCVVRELGAPCGNTDPARRVLEQLVRALAPGSYLAVCDVTDSHPAIRVAVELYNTDRHDTWTLRTPDQLQDLLTGLRPDLEVLSPGVVPVSQWNAEPSPFGTPADVDAWGGVLRLPTP